MRACLGLVFFALSACSVAPLTDEGMSSTSDLTTLSLAADVRSLEVGPAGELRVTLRDDRVLRVDDASGALTAEPNGSPDLTGFRDIAHIGWDAAYLYFHAPAVDWSTDRAIYRVGLDPAARPELITDVGAGVNVPDPVAIVVAGGVLYWTSLPNDCTLGDADSCWEMVLGRATSGGTAQRVKPHLASGQYVGLFELAFFDGDLYGANSAGVFKVPGGDPSKAVEPVCSFPEDFRTKMTNGTIFSGRARPAFAVAKNGFLVPLQSKNYESALGLVRWDCSTKMLTSFGPPAPDSGEVKTWGVTQIADIVVRPGAVFWLDRQDATSDPDADHYFALKKTPF